MELEAGVREALDEVLTDGRKDGNEHVVVVRDGQRVLRQDGDERHVSLESVSDAIQPGDIIIHNHPGELNSLSNVDLLLANRLNAHAIYAITDDGSIYKASDVSKAHIARMMLMFELELHSFVTASVEQTAKSVEGFSKRVNEMHWVNQRMDKAGFFKYEFELGPETAEFHSQFESKLPVEDVEAERASKIEAVLELIAAKALGLKQFNDTDK